MDKKNVIYNSRVKCRRGIMLIEITISLAVLALLIGGIYLSIRTFTGINYYHHAQQQCIAAGQGQLDSLLCRGEPLTEQQVKELWPKITLTIDKSDGTGQWQGLERVCVTARCITSMGKEVEVSQSRYLPKNSDEIQIPADDVSQPQINTTVNTL